MDEADVLAAVATARKAAALAAVCTIVAVFVLLIDNSIKRHIIAKTEEARAILAEFTGKAATYGTEAAGQAGTPEATASGGGGAGGADAGGGAGAGLPADDAAGAILDTAGPDKLPAANGKPGRAGGVASGTRGNVRRTPRAAS